MLNLNPVGVQNQNFNNKAQAKQPAFGAVNVRTIATTVIKEGEHKMPAELSEAMKDLEALRKKAAGLIPGLRHTKASEIAPAKLPEGQGEGIFYGFQMKATKGGPIGKRAAERAYVKLVNTLYKGKLEAKMEVTPKETAAYVDSMTRDARRAAKRGHDKALAEIHQDARQATHAANDAAKKPAAK